MSPSQLSQNDEETILQARGVLAEIERLQAELDPLSHRQSQLTLLASNVRAVIGYLENTHHTCAFMGSIGVGKTTAICRMLGLMDTNGDPLLSTSSGRTTVCEVEVRRSDRLAITVTPITEREMRTLLSEFIDAISPADEESAENAVALTAENQRVVRNMLEMRRRARRGGDGAAEQIDEALDALHAAGSREAFSELAWSRVNWAGRTTTELVSKDPEDRKWLKDTFQAINHGRRADVALPARLAIEIPWWRFGAEGLNIVFVDTKGLDGNVERKDLDVHIRNERSVYIACSRFADAPEQSVLDLLSHVADTGFKNQIASNSLLLVLERDNEAAKVTADDGQVETAEDGRLVREGQIADALAHRIHLSSSTKPQVRFFNASKSEEEEPIRTLVGLVERLRSEKRLLVHEAALALESVSAEEDAMRFRAAFAMAKRQIREWAARSQSQLAEMNALHNQLIGGITERGVNASSLRASVNRSGRWGNFDFYYKLASAARKKTVVSLQGSVDSLIALLTSHQKDEFLLPATSYFQQMARMIEQRSREIYDEATTMANNGFEQPLGSDASFWTKQRGQWGLGNGYRERIADGTADWFRRNNPGEIERSIQDAVTVKWDLLIKEVISLVDGD